MRILVTGGTGFTGKALALRLAELGHRVSGFDCREGVRTDELRAAGVEVVLGSVTDRELVRRSMAGVEVVHHLAAAFRETDLPPAEYHRVNVDGARIVAEEARRAGVAKFVHCSTVGVYGDVSDPPADEDAPLRPADYYQRTKLEGERAVERVAAEGLPFTIVRPAAIYGPGDPGRFLMIFRQVARGWFPIFGGGRTLYHPVFIDNLVDAFVLAMGAGLGEGRSYIVADRRFVTITELVRAVATSIGATVRLPRFPLWPLLAAGHFCAWVCRPLGVRPPIFPRRVDWYRQNRAFSIARARHELGYEPRVELEEGLSQTAAWCRAEGLLP